MLENVIFAEWSLSTSFTALASFFAFFTMLQFFCKSLVPVWITTMSGFLRTAGLIWSIRSSADAPGWGHILTESPRYKFLPLTFFIIESPVTTIFFFFRLMILRMKVFKTNLQFFESAILWNFWLILFTILKSVVSSGMTNTFIICLSSDRVFWAKTFWAWITLLLWWRIQSISLETLQ